jgi:hypothetical protein
MEGVLRRTSVDSFDSSSECPSHEVPKRNRKRRHAGELSPEELEATRRQNREAAQRHRQLAKQKASEQARRAEMIDMQNDELRIEAQRYTAELATLKRLLFDMYGPAGPLRGTLAFM